MVAVFTTWNLKPDSSVNGRHDDEMPRHQTCVSARTSRWNAVTHKVHVLVEKSQVVLVVLPQQTTLDVTIQRGRQRRVTVT